MSSAAALAELLDSSSPDDLKQSQASSEHVLQRAFRDYIGRADNHLHDLFQDWVQPSAKRARGPSSEDQKLRDFFTKCRSRGKGNGVKRKRTGDVASLIRAVKCLRTGTAVEEAIFRDLWTRKRSLMEASENLNPQQRLVASQKRIDDDSVAGEAARRIQMLFTHHEIEAMVPQATQQALCNHSSHETALAAATRHFADINALDFEEIQGIRKTARPYLELATRFGLGILLMIGNQTRDLWRVTTNEEISWLRDWCARHEPRVLEKAQKLNATMRSILLEGLEAYGANSLSFELGGTTLSRIFIEHCGRSRTAMSYELHDLLGTLAPVALGTNNQPWEVLEAECLSIDWPGPADAHDPLSPPSQAAASTEWNAYIASGSSESVCDALTGYVPDLFPLSAGIIAG